MGSSNRSGRLLPLLMQVPNGGMRSCVFSQVGLDYFQSTMYKHAGTRRS
jgi:hypothetical protein